jgi:hypothetical protein
MFISFARAQSSKSSKAATYPFLNKTYDGFLEITRITPEREKVGMFTLKWEYL